MCLSLFLCPVGVCGHQGTDGTVVRFSKDSFLISCVIFFSFSQACFCPSWASSTVHTVGVPGALEVASTSHRWVPGEGGRTQGTQLGRNLTPPDSPLKAWPECKGQWREHIQMAGPRALILWQALTAALCARLCPKHPWVLWG